MLHLWHRWLNQLGLGINTRKARKQRRAPVRSRARLLLEALEDRTCPSTTVVNIANGVQIPGSFNVGDHVQLFINSSSSDPTEGSEFGETVQLTSSAGFRDTVGVLNQAVFYYTVRQTGETFKVTTSDADDTGTIQVTTNGPMLDFTHSPTGTVPGAVIAPAVQVQVLDSHGDVNTSFNDNVTVALGTSFGNSATLSGKLTVQAVRGVATFSDLSVDKYGQDDFLIASLPDGTQANSNFFTVGRTLRFKQQPTSADTANVITPPVTVQVRLPGGVYTDGPVDTHYNGPVTIALANNPGSGTLSGTLTVQAQSGVASFSDLSISQLGQGYTLTAATPDGSTSTSGPFNIGTSVAFVQQPTDTAPGETISPAVQVNVKGPDGQLDSSFNGDVTVAISSTGGAGTLSGSRTVRAANGVATFDNLSIDVSGQYSLRATTNDGRGGFSDSFQIKRVLTFTQQPSSTAVGATMSTVEVDVTGPNGQPDSNYTGTISLALGANPGGGQLSGRLTVPVQNAVATFSDLSINQQGQPYTLSASTPDGTQATSDPFSIGAYLAFTQQPTNTVPGSVLPAVQVSVDNPDGQVNTSFNSDVSIALGANPGAGTLSGMLAVKAVNGVATFDRLSVDKLGLGYTLVASLGSAVQVTSNPFEVTHGVQFSKQPTDAAPGESIQPAVEVTALTPQGQTDTSYQGNVTLSLEGTGRFPTLGGAWSAMAANGVATFPNLSIGKVGYYELAATLGDGSEGNSSVIQIAHTLSFVQQPGTTGPGQPITPAVRVAVEDPKGQVDAGFNGDVTIALGANPGGGTLSGDVTVPAQSGVAIFNGLSIAAGGQGYTLVASIADGASASSAPFNIQSPTADFTGLGPTAMVFGTPAITASGRLAVSAGGDQASLAGATVTITLRSNQGQGGADVGVAPATATLDAAGNFSATLDLHGFQPQLPEYDLRFEFAANQHYPGVIRDRVVTVTQATPTVQLKAPASGPYTGDPFVATATVTGVDGVPRSRLEGIPVTVSYITSHGDLLNDPPTDPGTYKAVGAFVGSQDYEYAGASALFTISAVVGPTFSGVSPTIIAYGVDATIAGHVNGNLAGTTAVPTGNVTVTLGDQSQSVALDPQGNFQAAFDTHAWTVAGSPYPLTLSYGGDATYASASRSLPFVVDQHATTIVFASPPDATYTGNPYQAPAAYVDAQLAGLFAVDSRLENVNVQLEYEDFTGQSLTGPPTDAGSYWVRAVFPGSADFGPSESAWKRFTINKATTSVTLTAPGSGDFTGAPFLAGATVTDVKGTQAATLDGVAPVINYYDSSENPLAGPPTDAGSYIVESRFPSSANYQGSTYQTGHFTINKATPTIDISDAGGTYNGLPLSPAATIAGVNGKAGTSLEGVSLSLSYAQDGQHLLGAPSAAGDYTLTASFAGSQNYNSADRSASFTIDKAAPTIDVSASGGTYNGQSFAASATIAGLDGKSGANLESVGLSLTYYRDGQALAGAPSAAGEYTAVASFAGSKDYRSAKSTPAPFTIDKAKPTLTVSAAGGAYNGRPFPASATIAGLDGKRGTSLEGVGLTLKYSLGSETLAGAPVEAGDYTVVASFAGSQDYSAGDSAPAFFTITATKRVALGGLSAPVWTAEAPGYSGTIQVSGGTAPYDAAGLQVTGLPLGLAASLDPASGVITISGTPARSSQKLFNVHVAVADANGTTATATCRLTIQPPLAFGTLSKTVWTANQPGYSATLQVIGGVLPYSGKALQVDGLPAGLTASIKGQSGLITISGTPTEAVDTANNLTVTVQDKIGAVAAQSFTLTINTALNFTPDALPKGQVGQAYSQTIRATGGTQTTVSYALTAGKLAPGLTITRQGGTLTIAGTPTAAGSAVLRVTAKDQVGATLVQSYILAASHGTLPPTVTSVAPAQGLTSGGTLVTITGSNLAHAVAVEFGSTIITQFMSATASKIVVKSPTAAAGSVDLRVVTNIDITPITTADQFQYVQPPTLTPPTLPSGQVGTAYSQTISADGGTGTWSLDDTVTGTVPHGLSIAQLAPGGALTIRGTATVAGSFKINVTASDAWGLKITRLYSVTIKK